ncbi:tRNA pseudouridine synthase Pus10 [Linum perenne]
MSGETETELLSDTPIAAAEVAAANDVSGADGKEARLLADAIRSLHPEAVKDLLTSEVCIRCILRLFGFKEHFYFRPSISKSILHSVLGESEHLDQYGVLSDCNGGTESEVQPIVCRVCVGILQYFYRDEKDLLVQKLNADSLAASVVELVKQEGHEIGSFSLEVSVPAVILENDDGVWSYMKRKYGPELGFVEETSKCVSVKDALKLAITCPLESMLDVKLSSTPSSFRIRLTYCQMKSSCMAKSSGERNEGCKRRKLGKKNLYILCFLLFFFFLTGDVNAVPDRSSNSSGSSEQSKFPLEKVNEPHYLALQCYRTSIYFGGRYLKFSRNVSQTRWIIDDERMGESSVEEIIGSNILPACQGDSYKFHAAGREDIDVRMLGSGRPFLVEIQNARKIPSDAIIKETEIKINSMEKKLVAVKNLKLEANSGWGLMHEGEAEKQKQYCSLVWISRPLEDQDVQSIITLKDMKISQRTPVRVLHRRSPLDREKIIHWMKIEKVAESSQYFLLHLCTQAGTYIKEFVHGDFGRTSPSIGSILGCRAEILQLDVTDVKMEGF